MREFLEMTEQSQKLQIQFQQVSISVFFFSAVIYLCLSRFALKTCLIFARSTSTDRSACFCLCLHLGD